MANNKVPIHPWEAAAYGYTENNNLGQAPVTPPAASTTTPTAVETPDYIYSPSTARSKPMGAAELAALYGGITYDEEAIRSKFDAATKAEYEMLRKQYDITANKFYNQMYANQYTALDTIRRSNAAAVATGASRGIQAANELSAILGLQQTNSQTATDLANQRNLLMDKEAAAYTKNVVDALSASNAVKQALGNLGANMYASDTQFDVGAMNYYAMLNQAAKALEGTKYTADSNLAGTKYASDSNLTGTMYNADSNLKGVGISAQATKDAAGISANASIKAAEIANAAQKAYYDYMKSQGAGGTGAGQQTFVEGMNEVQGQFNKALQAKDYTSAAMWFMQMFPGMDYNAALKKVKEMGSGNAGGKSPITGMSSVGTGGSSGNTWNGTPNTGIPGMGNLGSFKNPQNKPLTPEEMLFFQMYMNNLPGTLLPKLDPFGRPVTAQP